MQTLLSLILAMVALLTLTAPAQTLNWGSEVFSDLRDSDGNVWDNSYVIELGAFNAGFDPTQANVQDWLTNWNVFDQAAYSQADGYFTGTTQMMDNGTSSSPWLTAGATSFAGLEAYIWIRSGDLPVPGSQWLVTRASSWVFSSPIPGCCDNSLPTEWSVSDLGTEVPKWGGQGSIDGPGTHTYNDPSTLQTFTFIPEPSSSLLTALTIVGLLLRRNRSLI